MKILYYSTSYYANHGGSIQSREFYRCLDHFPIVTKKWIFPQKNRQPVLEKAPSVSFKKGLKRVPLFQTYFFYRRNGFYLQKLEEKIKEVSPDVLLLQIDSNFLQIKILKSKFPNLLVCTQINGSPFDEPFRNIAFKNYFESKQREAYCQSDLNFFVSSFLRKHIMKELENTDRDKVVHNGTDLEKFKPLENKAQLRKKLNYPKNKFVIGYVGTLDYHKKLDILFGVMKKLKEQNHRAKLIILGDGAAFNHLKNQILEQELQDYVELRGWVQHQLINEHLNCFDVALHHHANDYMSPLKIFEYLSSGTPVIGPDIPSIREIFSDRKELLLTKPTTDDIYRNLVKILHHKPGIEEMTLQGFKTIQEKYSWNNYTENILEYIQEKL